MRTSVTSLSKKLVFTFIAATLALGLVPAAAFADVGASKDGSDGAVVSTTSAPVDATLALGDEEEGVQDGAQVSDDGSTAIIPAGEIINQVEPLQVVAQQESTRSYFLAQTLESTHTVPVVSAKLPLDTSSSNGDDDATGSTVVGSFEYLGMTFAIEAGEGSAALVAVDYDKLPQGFIENQAIVIPERASLEGVGSYSVSRIANGAFSSLTKDGADSKYLGFEALFADSNADKAEALIESGNEREVDVVAASVEDCAGILAVSIPASVTTIEDNAFTGFDTLQYIVVSDDNQNYASYDGALYGANLTNLRLIPEGRVGTIRVAPSATTADPEVFSHCPSVDTVVADPESEIYKLLEEWSSLEPQLISSKVMGIDSGAISDSFIGQIKTLSDTDFLARAVYDAASYYASVYTFVNCTSKESEYRNGAAVAGKQGMLHTGSANGYAYGRFTGNEIVVFGTQPSAQYYSLRRTDESPSIFLDYWDWQSTEVGKYTTNRLYWNSALTSPVAPGSYKQTFDVYLGWDYTKYTVAYAKGDGSGSHGSSTNLTIQSNLTLPSATNCGITRTDYTLTGWSVNGRTYSAGASINIGTLATAAGRTANLQTDTITLTPVWKQTTFYESVYTFVNCTSYETQYVNGVVVPDWSGVAHNGSANGYAYGRYKGFEIVVFGTQPSAQYISLRQQNGSGTRALDYFGWISREVGKYITQRLYWDSALTNPVAPGTYSQNVDVYLGWDYTKCTVSYAANGGTGSHGNAANLKITGNITFPTVDSCGITREGYTLTGWTVNGKTYSPGQTINVGTLATQAGRAANKTTDTITMTAQWGKNAYTIALNANGEGATVDPASISATYDTDLTLPTPVRSGYKFLGWNTEENGTGTNYSAGVHKNLTSTAGGSVELFAQWDALLFEVAWKDRDQTLDSEIVLCGNAVTMPDALEERTTHTFEGWKASTNGNVYPGGSSDFTMPDEDVMFTAVWKLKPCAVVFDPGTGAENISVVVPSPEPESSFAIPVPVRKEGGEVFSHWGIADDDETNLWYAGGSLTIEGILAGGYPEADVLASEEIDGITYHNVITLHAVWNPTISVSTPLVVTMAIDPDTGEMIAGEGYITTTGASEVSVLSLAYDKTDASSLGGGTDTVFGGSPDGISLTMAPVRDDASDIESAFASASPFALDLGSQDGLPVTDSTLNAFPKFGNGVSLRIRYGLAFPLGFDLSSLVSSLPDKTDTAEGSTWSRESYPIANLYYTVGLVPSA